jgi:hypothetical protein
MHTARATVSIGRLARLKMAWTRGTEAVASEADDGIRLTRCIAGPVIKVSTEKCHIPNASRGMT